VRFFIVPGKDGGETSYHLITENGEILAGHFCSNSDFALGDLEANRPERKKEWKEKFGDYKVMFLEDSEVTLDDLINRIENFEIKQRN
jgi:hypothetical protein